MRVFLTGLAGFVGRHLTRHLLDQGHEVSGTVRVKDARRAMATLPPGVTLHEADITDASALREALERCRPDAIVHLAAASRVGQSWDDPAAVVRTNVLGTLSLLAAVKAMGGDPLVLSVGSGEEYGQVHEGDLPVKETAPLRPVNPYAVSKMAQGLLALHYGKRHGLRVIHVRPFNHIGPGQPLGFITSDLASQLARIDRGLADPVLRVGNLDTARDYLDVRDVARAYGLLIRHGLPGEVYNVASGTPRSGREVLAALRSFCARQVEVREDPQLSRPAEVPVLAGDASRLLEATHWQPRFSFEESLREVYTYWLGEV